MTTDSVFISYSNEDVDFANKIANSLKASGIDIWIDTINGKDDDAIQEAIKSAKHFLIITSNNALNNETLSQEKNFARKHNVERTLVKIEACDTNSKMRWEGLPCIDLTSNFDEGLEVLLEKLGGRKAVTKSTPPLEKNETVEKTADIKPEQKPVATETSKATESPSLNNDELLRKESLLVSDDDIDSVRNVVEDRIKGAKNQTYIYIAGAVGLIVLVLTNGSFQEMFTEGKDQIDGALGFIEKFYPGISAALPTVISGGAFKKLKEHKQNIIVIDQIKNKRDRIKKAINSFSEPEIIKLEEDLEKLIKF